MSPYESLKIHLQSKQYIASLNPHHWSSICVFWFRIQLVMLIWSQIACSNQSSYNTTPQTVFSGFLEFPRRSPEVAWRSPEVPGGCPEAGGKCLTSPEVPGGSPEVSSHLLQCVSKKTDPCTFLPNLMHLAYS